MELEEDYLWTVLDESRVNYTENERITWVSIT